MTDRCTTCGFPPFATGRDIERYRQGTPIGEIPQIREPMSTSWWLLFPEILFAAPLVAFSPFWAIRLASSGHPLLSALWCTTVVVGTSLFFRYIRKKKVGAAYGAVLSILVIAVGILSYI
jgi:hypothetical protein